MIGPVVLAAFFASLVVETIVVVILDRRALAREAAWWAELRADALNDYGRVFDWETDL